MRGRLHALRLVLPEVRRGIEYYEQSIAEDPSYALPYAGIADALRALVLSNDVRPSEMAPRAKAAAQRAIELAPNLPEANSARGMIAFWFDWDWVTAQKYLARAVELAPNNADAQIYLAHVHSNLARKEDALRHARRASELDPVSPLIGTLEGQFLSYHGEHEAAIRKLRETISLEPRFWLSHHTLAIALIETGQYEESIRESQEAKQLSPLQTFSDTLIAVALARSGRPDDARALLKILTESARERYVPPFHFAMIETALGNRDAAIAQLEASRSVGDVRLTYLKIEPKLDDLRDDPRFKILMRELHF
jgi:tetratricopeptide (TPR) repeat protein